MSLVQTKTFIASLTHTFRVYSYGESIWVIAIRDMECTAMNIRSVLEHNHFAMSEKEIALDPLSIHGMRLKRGSTFHTLHPQSSPESTVQVLSLN